VSYVNRALAQFRFLSRRAFESADAYIPRCVDVACSIADFRCIARRQPFVYRDTLFFDRPRHVIIATITAYTA